MVFEDMEAVEIWKETVVEGSVLDKKSSVMQWVWHLNRDYWMRTGGRTDKKRMKQTNPEDDKHSP
ncbi:hypothetical protein T265_07418 [Opisthorchis viverrini]|uniref:Uncharacterized protein n=1 Tax=Opisthorchis viverrini TaxID=6198 RepID=A0A074ZCW6_OPIVI|nr:hypothetical protein T265_07418 [Opisthorchis viverrini]KER25023.1 hypothetical protein T265_07418 [Opisthorchis viverrini]